MDKMREEFEAWTKQRWVKPNLNKYESGYENATINEQWQAWQASRKALVVELPHAAFFNDANDSPALCYRVAEIEKALDAAGVAYK